jgi:hypothetical protein
VPLPALSPNSISKMMDTCACYGVCSYPGSSLRRHAAPVLSDMSRCHTDQIRR